MIKKDKKGDIQLHITVSSVLLSLSDVKQGDDHFKSIFKLLLAKNVMNCHLFNLKSLKISET